MVVNITGTSEITSEQISRVVSILNKNNGPIIFKALLPIWNALMPRKLKDIDKKENYWIIFDDLEII